jgi:hypothetical protein
MKSEDHLLVARRPPHVRPNGRQESTAIMAVPFLRAALFRIIIIA